MHVFKVWGVLCVLSAAGSSLCVTEIEDDDSFAGSYGNEISLDQQQGEFCFDYFPCWLF